MEFKQILKVNCIVNGILKKNNVNIKQIKIK